jgi:23S rRNA (uracil1939-C5)-methyltransferase
LEGATLHNTEPSVPKPLPTPRTGGVRRGDVVEVAVEKLVFGGDGLARVGAQVVFVPLAAPGDELRIRVTEVGRGFARGVILEVLKPGPARRDPRCRHFGVCGGCTLQHVGYAAQVAAKAEFVRESLRRLGGIDWTGEIPVRTAAEYGYRARAEVQARRGHVGWFRTGTHEIVDVDECPVLVPEAEALLARLRAEPPRHAVHIAAGDDGTATADPRATVRRRVAGFDFEIAPDAFFQGNRLLANALVLEATAGPAGALAADLYAGAGLFSLALARRFARVVSVEGRRAASAQAAANAQRNGIANVEFAAQPVEEWLAAHTGARPDLVLLDPPRTGTGAHGARLVAALGASAITYVSCDPATLARDLRTFAAAGYGLESVVALDMFPQTHHVETVAKLRHA